MIAETIKVHKTKLVINLFFDISVLNHLTKVPVPVFLFSNIKAKKDLDQISFCIVNI